MLRSIGGAVLGYILMAFVIFVGLTLAYLALGADGAFQPGSFEVSMLWIVISLAIGFGAAFLAGWTARKVAREARGPWLLAGIMVVLGLGMTLPILFGDAVTPGVRTSAIGSMEAMQRAQTPGWVMLTNLLVGVIGVLLGGRVLGTARSPEPENAVHAG